MSKEVVKVLEGGGFSLEGSDDTGQATWGCNYYALVTYDAMQNLEGKVLTIIDASFQDKEQRKAVKDVFRRTFWFDWAEHSIYRGKDACPVGMPSTDNLER